MTEATHLDPLQWRDRGGVILRQTQDMPLFPALIADGFFMRGPAECQAAPDFILQRDKLDVSEGLMNVFGRDVSKLPFTIRILLENLIRFKDGVTVRAEDIDALAQWDGKPSDREIAFRPGRVLLQDFTGVPAVVDLAAMRDAMKRLGGQPDKINPLLPMELVIDHSVQVDVAGVPDAFRQNNAVN